MASSSARTRIKRWLKQAGFDQSVSLGREMLERKLKELHLGMPSEEVLKEYAEHLDRKSADDLLADSVEAASANYLIAAPDTVMRAEVQVRYRQKPVPAEVFPREGGRVGIRLASPLRAVTPGQSLVFYDGDILVGGAVIERASME